MRRIFCFLLVASVAWAAPLTAQEDPKKDDKKEEKKDDKKKKEKTPIAKLTDVRVGFHANDVNAGNRYKVGLWAPVYVSVAAGEDGLPVNGRGECKIEVETVDSEGVGAIYTLKPVTVEPDKTQTFVAYVKTGNLGADVKVSLNVDGRIYSAPPAGTPLELNSHVYLTLGARLKDMEAGLALFGAQNLQGGNFNQSDNRFAAYESDYARLPEAWFGYQGVDLVILTTENKKFLSALASDKNPTRLKALAQWVRRGGRLVISANWQNQDLLATLLQNPQAWSPPVPVVPPPAPADVKRNGVKNLNEIADWDPARRPFAEPDDDLILLTQLQPASVKPGDWEVMKQTPDGRPLIARMPYGLGSITLLAFSLDQGPFTRWEGRAEFLKSLVMRLAPPASAVVQDFNNGRFNRGGMSETPDLTTELQSKLDLFDVQMVPFGWVALFIVLYIIVVGPLDYVILRFVFKRLEWTWFTFPTVVLAVSVAAYFTAYALKGNDLKVNKVDLVDFDLRTDLDAERKPARAYAYGQTFFTILSPRIQNYTIGIEPNPVFWGGAAGKPASADQLSWLGRPNVDQPGGMGRSGAQGFFRRPYHFAEDAAGVTNVPIPVWTTKSFNASWEMALDQLPFEADLQYHSDNEANLTLSGKLHNNLPVNLVDAWLIYRGSCYLLEDGLPAKKAGAKATDLKLGRNQVKGFGDWVQALGSDNRVVANKAIQDPTRMVKQMLFHDAHDVAGKVPNHGQRPLDLSWRVLIDGNRVPLPGELRQAILVARVAFRNAPLEAATTDDANPLPTKLWLGDLPGPEKTRPPLQGQIYQDTFVRVLLPVRAARD